jgi:segregation and condensation protein B
MENQQLKYIVEAALLAAGRPLDLNELQSLFGDEGPPGKDDIRAAIVALQADYADRGIALQEVASGFRVQVRTSMSSWLARLWEERAPRYSRALMETLAIIAYRQPVTRGDVEDIRGVGVTTNIMRSLLERNWIRVVGFRDVPGKPAIYGTTREFLDYFGLKKLDDLPPLADLKDLEAFSAQLELSDAESLPAGAGAPLPALLQDDLDDPGLATVTPISDARSYAGAPAESPSNVVPLKVR